MDYETTEHPLVLLLEQAGVIFGISLGGCRCEESYLNSIFSETSMDKEFFMRDASVTKLNSTSKTDNTSQESEPLDAAIQESAMSPKRVQGDAGSVEQHSLQDLIAADKFLQSKKAVKNGFGLRFTKISPDGTV